MTSLPLPLWFSILLASPCSLHATPCRGRWMHCLFISAGLGPSTLRRTVRSWPSSQSWRHDIPVSSSSQHPSMIIRTAVSCLFQGSGLKRVFFPYGPVVPVKRIWRCNSRCRAAILSYLPSPAAKLGLPRSTSMTAPPQHHEDCLNKLKQIAVGR